MKFESIERMKRNGTYEEVKIKCRFCSIKKDCHLRARKEKVEESGITTYCPFTPNRKKTSKQTIFYR